MANTELWLMIWIGGEGLADPAGRVPDRLTGHEPAR